MVKQTDDDPYRNFEDAEDYRRTHFGRPRPLAFLAVDRRQLLAAAQLICAVDLPMPLTTVSQLMIEAANVCPGLLIGEIEINSRVTALKRARSIIDDMLREVGAE